MIPLLVGFSSKLVSHDGPVFPVFPVVSSVLRQARTKVRLLTRAARTSNTFLGHPHPLVSFRFGCIVLPRSRRIIDGDGAVGLRALPTGTSAECPRKENFDEKNPKDLAEGAGSDVSTGASIPL